MGETYSINSEELVNLYETLSSCEIRSEFPKYFKELQPLTVSQIKLSRDMRFPTMWYVRPAKAQTSLRIRAV